VAPAALGLGCLWLIGFVKAELFTELTFLSWLAWRPVARRGNAVCFGLLYFSGLKCAVAGFKQLAAEVRVGQLEGAVGQVFVHTLIALGEVVHKLRGVGEVLGDLVLVVAEL